MPVAVPDHALRKYSDLIFTGSRLQWGFWDPSTQIACGDYGEMNEETGVFERQGNIYDEGYAGKYGIPQPVMEEEKTKEQWTVSKNARILSYGKEARIPHADIKKLDVRGHIQFVNDRGAILVTLDSITTHIPQKKLLKQLIDEPGLHGKHLVCEVEHSTKYARYFSGPAGGDICIGYDGTEWIQHGIDETKGDFWQTGNADAPSFFPLFRLLVVRDRGPILLLRDSPEPEDPKQLLAPLYPPWGALDEEGEQIPGSDKWGVVSEEDFLREVAEDERRQAELDAAVKAAEALNTVAGQPPAAEVEAH